jgi:hypothetical protein
MSITTYSELQDAVADWLNRDDLEDQVPTFIQLGEAELRRRLQGVYVETGLLALETTTVALPADAGVVEQVFVEANGRTYTLVQTDTMGVIMARGAVAGRPTHFAVVQGDLWLGPVPDQTYTGTIVYEPWLNLSTTQTTNWVLDENSDAYLYASLIAASPYLKDDVRVMTWRDLLERIVRDIKVRAERQRYGGRLVMTPPIQF